MYECIICYEDKSTEDEFKLPCGHFYHRSCIETWGSISLTCPSCRAPFPTDNLEIKTRELLSVREIKLLIAFLIFLNAFGDDSGELSEITDPVNYSFP